MNFNFFKEEAKYAISKDRNELLIFFTLYMVLSELFTFSMQYMRLNLFLTAMAIVFIFIMMEMLQFGLEKGSLASYRNHYFRFDTLFDGVLDHFNKTFWLLFRKNVTIFAWSLLFIIPGIVKYCQYAMVFKLIADEPDMENSEAFETSREMMAGHKVEFLLLLIYIAFPFFLLWAALSIAIPFMGLSLISTILFQLTIMFAIKFAFKMRLEMTMVVYYEYLMNLHKQYQSMENHYCY